MKKACAVLAAAVFCLTAALSPALATSSTSPRMAMTKEEFTASNGFVLPYRLYVPEGYDESKQYPLMIYFHGAGERGTDNEKQVGGTTMCSRLLSSHGIDYECLIIAPQCPENMQWVNTPWVNGSYSLDQVPISVPMKAACELLDKTRKTYSIDAKHIYASGYSMGGFGTWDIVMRNPNTFAAAVPVCGSADPSKAATIKNTAIMTFHGVLDPTVPVQGTRDMVTALERAGADVTYIEYEDMEHGIWPTAFNSHGLLEWLFSKELKLPFYPCGDVNEDGEIDSVDALTVLQHIVGIQVLQDGALPAADAFQDGKIDSIDSLCILQYCVGMTKLPVKPS